MDDLGVIEAVAYLGPSVVIAVADVAERGFYPGFGKKLGVFYGHVLGEFNWSSQCCKNGMRWIKKRRSDQCTRLRLRLRGDHMLPIGTSLKCSGGIFLPNEQRGGSG